MEWRQGERKGWGLGVGGEGGEGGKDSLGYQQHLRGVGDYPRGLVDQLLRLIPPAVLDQRADGGELRGGRVGPAGGAEDGVFELRTVGYLRVLLLVWVIRPRGG